MKQFLLEWLRAFVVAGILWTLYLLTVLLIKVICE